MGNPYFCGLMENIDSKEILLTVIRISELLEQLLTPTAPKEVEMPEPADLYWVIKKLGISRSTFYSRIRKKLLQPVCRIGNREYYDRGEVLNLIRRKQDADRPFNKYLQP
ncbi:hypothetical protein SAMN05216436_102271 [bacterium A37T11]|nr:hypothetical protein SAMN05216436_102271 [bacterium A37T11]